MNSVTLSASVPLLPLTETIPVKNLLYIVLSYLHSAERRELQREWGFSQEEQSACFQAVCQYQSEQCRANGCANPRCAEIYAENRKQWVRITPSKIPTDLSHLIHVMFDSFHEKWEQCIDLCKKLRHVESLEFSHCRLIDRQSFQESFHKLSSLPNRKNIECIAFFDFRSIAENVFEDLAQFTSLQRLQVHQSNKFSRGFPHLPAISQLRSLSLNDSSINNDWEFAHLALSSSLESVSCSYMFGLTNRGLCHIGRIAGLRSLDLSGCYQKWDEDGLAHLERAVHLRKFFVSVPDLSVRGMASIAKLKRLEILELFPKNPGKMGDEMMEVLGTIHTLRVLYLGGEGATTLGVSHLTRLRNLESLLISAETSLNLYGLRCLAQLPRLRALGVNGCVGIAKKCHPSLIPSITGFQNLEKLDLRWIPLSIDFVDCLLKLKKLKTVVVSEIIPLAPLVLQRLAEICSSNKCTLIIEGLKPSGVLGNFFPEIAHFSPCEHPLSSSSRRPPP